MNKEEILSEEEEEEEEDEEEKIPEKLEINKKLFNSTQKEQQTRGTLEEVKKRLEDPLLSSKEVLFNSHLNTNKLKKAYLKNLIVLSFGFMLVFSAFFSLRNLQTSLNRKQKLGLWSLTCMNSTFALGCILANSIVQKARPKKVINLMLFGNLFYVVSNFYPSFFTLLPATLILGFTMANLLVAQSTYLTSIAVSHASVSCKRPDYVISVFNGYFLFMMYLAHFIGNLISSTVFYLFPAPFPNSTHFSLATTQTPKIYTNSNSISCGFMEPLPLSNNQSNFPPKISLDDQQLDLPVVYILITIFTLTTLQGQMIILFFLDKLDVIFYKCKQTLKTQLGEIWRLHLNPRLRFILPLMLYLGFQEAFIYADFTNSHITCSLGLHMIGFVMMTFSAMDSIFSFLCGYLRRFASQIVMVTFGFFLHGSLLIWLYFWKPWQQGSWVVFVVAGGLGVVDGIWQTLTNSLCGIMFTSKQRVAIFSILRMYQALGFTLASIYSDLLFNEVKVSILFLLLLISVISFFLLECHNNRKRFFSSHVTSCNSFNSSSSSFKPQSFTT